MLHRNVYRDWWGPQGRGFRAFDELHVPEECQACCISEEAGLVWCKVYANKQMTQLRTTTVYSEPATILCVWRRLGGRQWREQASQGKTGGSGVPCLEAVGWGSWRQLTRSRDPM